MKKIEIIENDANQRLDKFLKKLFPLATRGLIYKFNRKGKIKVNNKKKDNEYKLQVGDEVKIYLKDEDFKKLSSSELQKKNTEVENKLDKKDIVFEDNNLLVINKNSGINVHPGDYKTKEVSLIEQAIDYLQGKFDSLTFKPSLIHRLDRETSGIVLIAKKKDILQKLAKDFKEHKKVEKIYYAVVLGRLSRQNGVIKKSLKRIENANKEDKIQVSSSGKKAITYYKVLKEYKLKTKSEELILSELEVRIETGRMHQIRVHLASLGNPILGDKKYGNLKLNTFFKNNFGLNRQILHAWKIKFFHYSRGKYINLEARIKDDLKEFIFKLENTKIVK